MLEDGFQQRQDSQRRATRHGNRKCGVSITGGRNGTLMNGRENKRQQERKLEEFRSFRTSKRRKKKGTKE